MDPTGLIPTFGSALWTVAAFVVALSVIVSVHEFGHYIVGRWSGIDAEVFSIGFGPVLASRSDRRGTRWQLAALPLGGYVKFLGDSDSASAGRDDEVLEAMTEDTRRRTMHGAPLWARALTVAAGPVFNFALSIAVFALILVARGTASEPLTIAELPPLPGETALEPGDRILAIAGRETPPLSAFDGYIDTLPVAAELDYRVERDGETLSVPGPYPYPPVVSSVSPDSAAADAGLRPGDVILSVAGDGIAAFDALRRAVEASAGSPLDMRVWRDGEVVEMMLLPRRVDLPTAGGGFETRWLIGITGGLFFTPQTDLPGPVEALGYGVDQTVFIVQSSLSGIWHMAAGAISSCNLSGPLGIAETSGAAASQGVVTFVWFIAVLSTAVGLLNLFPVPVLDGGHLVFHAYEAVSGRPPSDRALRLAMTAGLALMLMLMAFALMNDIFCP